MRDQRALVELRHRDTAGELVVVFQARKMKGGREGKAGKGGKGGLHSWRIGFAHPLSAFQVGARVRVRVRARVRVRMRVRVRVRVRVSSY